MDRAGLAGWGAPRLRRGSWNCRRSGTGRSDVGCAFRGAWQVLRRRVGLSARCRAIPMGGSGRGMMAALQRVQVVERV